MARRMLINAIHPEECRVAIVEDDRLLELEIERADHTQLKGNIYKASITRVEPSLQAAFLDIGSTRNGFLQINDINPSYFNDWPPDEGSDRNRPLIQSVLQGGQELVVQVVKDERDLKGATLTTNLSIPGRYLVLMIGNQRGGVSRKINDDAQRSKLRQAMHDLQVPPGMGVIVRTAGINKSSAELQRDLDGLIDIWHEIVTKSLEPASPKLLYKETDLALRTIRDYLSNDIDEILIDCKETFDRASQFINKIVPVFASKVQYYDQPRPLFSGFHLDRQIEEISQAEVTLQSGGSIVISVTEAIVAVDVNSGRSTSLSDVEETAYNTNLEAAETIARQLRLRDLGGLVVIDFIDMLDKRHKANVEKALKDAVRYDKAKVEIGRISKFGLLEMSRQRLKSSLASQSEAVCPHCSGRGRVKTPESASLEALRKIQSAVYAGGVSKVRVRMAPGAALLLLNNKRKVLYELEQATGTEILVFADGRMKPEQYELELDTGKHEGYTAPSQENLPRGNDNRYRRDDDDRRRNNRGRRGGDDRRNAPREGRGEGYDRGDNRNRNKRGGNRRDRNRHRGPNYQENRSVGPAMGSPEQSSEVSEQKLPTQAIPPTVPEVPFEQEKNKFEDRVPQTSTLEPENS